MTHTQAQKLFILARTPGRLSEFERFVTRRGWEVKVFSDFKIFLTAVTTERPSHLLFSTDFPHPQLSHVAKMLVQVYRSELIEFAEEDSSESWNRLTQSKNPKVFGELTGPSFERALFRLRAQETKQAPLKESFQAGVRLSLRSVLGAPPAGLKAVKPLSWTMELSCIEVRSTQMSGRFLVASSLKKTHSEDVLVALKDALTVMMKSLGIKVEAVDTFTFETRKVEFDRWAQESAQFLEKTLHEGAEVSLAFFPLLEGQPDFLKTNESMVEIPMNEIIPDHKVDFDLYLHLPMNHKYLLYVSSGSWITLQQQLNLQGRNIRSMHVKPEQQKAVRSYRTARQVSEEIAHYYETRQVAA